jgi:hypothetical protein
MRASCGGLDMRRKADIARMVSVMRAWKRDTMPRLFQSALLLEHEQRRNRVFGSIEK